ncbi:hypothetical protein CIB84_007487 [Bambusicola thoracicus]|uniref:Uncharacterized protein n=1 Tax=Bambusicola thoracicus TaxID=9083 RepID=A0A2P4SXC5_BAMTH|nr:hypothetical protein CIB84_007487 [Bambusicola thoracicus]
MRILAWAF